MEKEEWQLHAENMRRLVVSISEMFDALSMSNSRKEIWILTSSPALGNLTLRLHHKDNKDSYNKLNNVLSKIYEEREIPIHLICFGNNRHGGKKTISEFYNEAKEYYLNVREQLGLSKEQIEKNAEEALDEARALIRKISRREPIQLRGIPDISIWAYEIKDSSSESKCRAIFYLNVIETLPIKITAFNVCNTKLAENLISIVRAKEDQKN